MFNNYEEMITIDDVCDMLSIGRNAAYRLLLAKQIKAFRIGRVWKIPRISVEEYILRQCGLPPNNSL